MAPPLDVKLVRQSDAEFCADSEYEEKQYAYEHEKKVVRQKPIDRRNLKLKILHLAIVPGQFSHFNAYETVDLTKIYRLVAETRESDVSSESCGVQIEIPTFRSFFAL